MVTHFFRLGETESESISPLLFSSQQFRMLMIMDQSSADKTTKPHQSLARMAKKLLGGQKKTIFEARLPSIEPSVTDSANSSPPTTGSTPASESTRSPIKLLPAEQLVLPVSPLKETVIFPHTESVLTFGRARSINALKSALQTHNLVVLVNQKKGKTDKPQPGDLFDVGTLAMIDRTLKTDQQFNALVHGTGRVKIIRYLRTEPFLLAQVIKLADVVEHDEELTALTTHLQKEFRRAIQMGKAVEFLNFMKLMGGVSESELVDQIASTLESESTIKQTILETLEVKVRMSLVLKQLSHEMKVLEIEKDVAHKTQAKFDKYMRENVLRERLRTIQKELGELDEEEELSQDYDQRLKKLEAPPEVKEKIAKEVKKLKMMSVNNPEGGYVRSWLDTIFELPWSQRHPGSVDLHTAQQILEQNHYGLKKVKERILEFMAVLKLKQINTDMAAADTPQTSSPSTHKPPAKSNSQTLTAKTATLPTILCFVGPPGVGKTSIGRSIAQALGREFVKASLGGIRDEAEIRGHRRTYVGAMPGRIIAGLKQIKTKNPVFMLDEIDKIGQDFRGDPSSALLEALDPEQNFAFEDHYLDVPFDLSEVLF